AMMAVPAWQFAAESEGFGRAIYDVLDERAWNRVFGGPIPVTVGYVLKETVETSPDLVQAYVNATYRAQQWIRRAKDDEIVDLLHTPYMDTFKREDILKSVRYYKTLFDWDFIIDERESADQEFAPIVGPAGCGKSTILNMLGGRVTPSAGAIEVDGGPVTDVPRKVGYVFQKDTVFPWRTVRRNVALGLEYRGVRGTE